MNELKLLKTLYNLMEYDGYGWWINNTLIGEPSDTDENKPTFEEFLILIDAMNKD